ncbi:hypothetical protein BASA81_000267 [Batrachochytrium salamandrivorans]|nr:hypothetical protein BASA81_000267 [Batrachochytrium salamandrivorans]
MATTYSTKSADLPPAKLSGWFCRKKRGTVFFNKFAPQSFWELDGGRLSEFNSDGKASVDSAFPVAAYQLPEETDVEASTTRELVSYYEVTSMAQILKEKSDELLIVFRDDSTLALRAMDAGAREEWCLALNAGIFRPPSKSNLSVFRRTTLTNSTSSSLPNTAGARLSKRTSISTHKERMSAHFSRAQLLAKQINKKTDDSFMRKRGSKEPDVNDDNNSHKDRMRVVVVPSIAHEERVDPSRFIKTQSQIDLLLLAINRDLLPIAASVFASAHVSAQSVLDLMFSVDVEEDTHLIVQGEASDRMYVIESGECGVYSKDFADLPPQFEIMKRAGESFGLLALLYSQPAPFLIKTEYTKCRLWALPRNQFFQTNREATRKNHGHKLLLLLDSLKDALESVFDVLSINTLEQIADSMEFTTYRLGQVIVHEGDVMNKIYIVDEGEVLGDVTLAHGDVFGAECLQDTEVLADMTLMADSDVVTVLTINAEEIRYFFGKQQSNEVVLPPTPKISEAIVVVEPPTPKKRTKGTIMLAKKTLGKFPSASREALSTSGLLVFVEEVEEDGVRLNLDLPFERNLPKLRPEIKDLDQLEFKSFLGRGQFGTVHLVEYNQQERFALKVLQGNVITLNGWEEMVQQERDAMLELAHSPCRFLCKLHSYFSDRKNIYFVLEYVDCGTLQDHMELHGKNPDSLFHTTEVMQFYLACVVLGLEAIHHHDICYRDLKPENMMMSSTGYCQLADFGLAKKTRRTFTFCGSPQFMAPETLLNRGHGLAVDWWASGIFLFEMMCGYTPFAAFESSDTFEKVLAYNDNPTPAYLFYPKLKATSEDTALTRNLIENLLFPKQNKRLGVRFPGVSGIKQHAFFGGFDWTKMQQMELKSPFIPQPPPARDVSKKYDPNLFAVPDDMTGWTRKF